MITREEVLRIAALARLGIDAEEADRLTGDLNSILEHVETLARVELGQDAGAGGGPAAPLRDDVPSRQTLAFSIDEIAPGWRDGFFTVPRLASMSEPPGQVGHDHD